MGSYFIDFDGVFFEFGTMTPAEEAVAFVNKLVSEGHQVFFTTKRLYKNNNDPRIDLCKTEEALKNLGVKYTGIIEGVNSLRILINDEGAIAINHKRNGPLNGEIHLNANEISPVQLEKKVYNILATLSWVGWKYPILAAGKDYDDYIQTMVIARSLIANNGFDHADLVKRYREPVTTITSSARDLLTSVAIAFTGSLTTVTGMSGGSERLRSSGSTLRSMGTCVTTNSPATEVSSSNIPAQFLSFMDPKRIFTFLPSIRL